MAGKKKSVKEKAQEMIEKILKEPYVMDFGLTQKEARVIQDKLEGSFKPMEESFNVIMFIKEISHRKSCGLWPDVAIGLSVSQAQVIHDYLKDMGFPKERIPEVKKGLVFTFLDVKVTVMEE